MKTIKKIFASILSMLSATSAMTVSADVINDEIDMNETNDDNIEREAETASATIMDDENVDFDESAQPVAEYTENEITEVAANAKNYAVETMRTNIASDDYYIVGDANVDYQLNVRDAACVARALAKSKTKTLPEAADYTQDDIINVRDAAGIARYCAESYSSDKPLTTVPVTQPAVTTTTTVADEIVVTNSVAADDAATTYTSHNRPLTSCTCTTDENTVTCPNCGIPYNCSCEALPEAHKLATTTTTTVATQTTEKAETNSVTSTNQDGIKTEITTDASIDGLPVETVTTTTTVTTTSEPVETTTVTTTTQVVETTVNKDVENILDNYIIHYNIKPILEEHDISHNEKINETKWFYDWNNGKYPDYTLEALRERYGENYDGNLDRFTALNQWYRDVIGKEHAGFFTRWNIIGWEYELQVIGDKRNSPVVAMSVEDFTATTGIELPLEFTSSRLVDADGNIYDAWADSNRFSTSWDGSGFWTPTSNNLPDYGNYNIVEHLDELMSAPVIYYR